MLEEKNVNDVYDWVRVEPIEPTGLLLLDSLYFMSHLVRLAWHSVATPSRPQLPNQPVRHYNKLKILFSPLRLSPSPTTSRTTCNNV